jgi:hypothetical protein
VARGKQVIRKIRNGSPFIQGLAKHQPACKVHEMTLFMIASIALISCRGILNFVNTQMSRLQENLYENAPVYTRRQLNAHVCDDTAADRCPPCEKAKT